MKFGAPLYGIDPDGLGDVARRAEALGYESLWRGEHVVLPAQWGSPYPYSSDGLPYFSSDTPLLDPFQVFAYVAATTTTIRLVTGLYLLALRNPVVAARELLTLDILSGGRVTFGVGTGWLAEEFDAVGTEFRTRGHRMDESLEIIDALFTRKIVRYEGAHHDLLGVRFEPKPIQKPRPPIIVGGTSPPAMRRAARYADGWYGHEADLETVERQVRALGDLRQREAPDREPLEITLMWSTDVDPATIAALEDLGVARMVPRLSQMHLIESRAALAEIERFAEQHLTEAGGLAPDRSP